MTSGRPSPSVSAMSNADTSLSNAIVRADVWNRYRHGWAPEYAGDYAFMATLWAADLRWAWLDRVVAEQPAALRGAGEGGRPSAPTEKIGEGGSGAS